MAGYDANVMTRLHQQLAELSSIRDDLWYKRLELERQLVEIQKSIGAADRAVETKQSEIHEHQNRLNPVVSLPPEILSLIFLDVVGFQVDHGTLKSPYAASFILAVVCQRWRSIVLSDPRLWTHVNLEHSRRYNLELFLSRSAGLPLDISLPLSKSQHTRTMIWHPFVREAHRWQRLWMDLSTLLEDDIRPLLSQKRAENLTYICLVNNRKRPRHGRPVFAAHQNHLRTLILVRIPMPKVLFAPHLQHLTFTSGWEDTRPELRVSYNHFRHFLMSTTHLQTLGIGVQSVAFGEQNVEPISLPSLRRLTLYFHKYIPGQLSNLLDMISAPALQVMELTAEDQTCKTDDADAYVDFMVGGKPRYPTVTTAILFYVIYYHLDAEQLIEAFPNIKSLTVESSSIELVFSALQLEDWKSMDHIRVYVPQQDIHPFKAAYCWDLRELLECQHERAIQPYALRLELVIDQKHTDEELQECFDALGSLSLLTVIDESEDASGDAPWKFWENYGRSRWVPRKVGGGVRGG